MSAADSLALPHILRGATWSSSGSIVKLILQVGVQVAYTRLLPVESIGLWAAASIVLLLGTLISDGGLSTYVLQRPTLTAADQERAVGLQLLIATPFFLGLVLARNFIGVHLGMPALCPYMPVLGLAILLMSLTQLEIGFLRHRCCFKEAQLIDLTGFAAGHLLVGLPLAVITRHWSSMVFGHLAYVGLAYVLLAGNRATRLRLRFDRETMRAFVSTFKLLVLNVQNWLLQTADSSVVARLAGAPVLGLYNRAQMLGSTLPSQALNGALQVMLPVYAQTKELGRQVKMYAVSVEAGLCLAVPAAAMLIFFRKALISIAFGARWQGAEAFLLPVGLAVPFQVLVSISGPFLVARGQVRPILFGQSLLVAALASGYGAAVLRHGGPRAIVWIAAGSWVARAGLYLAIALLQDGVRAADLAAAVGRSMLPTGILMAGFAAGSRWTPAGGILGILIGSAAIGAIWLMRPGVLASASFREAVGAARAVFRRKERLPIGPQVANLPHFQKIVHRLGFALASPRLLMMQISAIARDAASSMARAVFRPPVTVASQRKGRRALVCYTSLAFSDPTLGEFHSNLWECRTIVRLLVELGYEVDAIDSSPRRAVDFRRYALLFGFGETFEASFDSPFEGRRILHLTTANPYLQNLAELRRIQAAELRTGRSFRARRQIDGPWLKGFLESDAVTCLGTQWCVETYASLGRVPTRIPVTFVPAATTCGGGDGFLWLGGDGAIHKGLDLLVEAFTHIPATLHICGNVQRETDFWSFYGPIIERSANIQYHGFVYPGPRLAEIVAGCRFVVLPSCAEGASSGVLTSMAAGLIPVTTSEASFDLFGHGVSIEEGTVASVADALDRCLAFSAEELQRRSDSARSYANQHHSREQFERRMRAVLEGSLDHDAFPKDGDANLVGLAARAR